ncbi:MAG: hypothetical protein FWD27_07095 [Coriobacteriia bacterium]|nr:hypothetical protein [Coriobacteriia bacterium]
MRKAIAVLMALLAAGLFGCGNLAVSETQDVGDFNFSLSYGYEGRGNIDTFSNTLTKDLIRNGTETVSFVIPEEKMQDILDMFVVCKITELPDDINAYAMESLQNDKGEPLDGSPLMTSTPADSYTLTYTLSEETRTIVSHDGGPWDGIAGPPDAHQRLVQFVDFVREYIYSTEEYKQMSPASGLYL